MGSLCACCPAGLAFDAPEQPQKLPLDTKRLRSRTVSGRARRRCYAPPRSACSRPTERNDRCLTDQCDGSLAWSARWLLSNCFEGCGESFDALVDLCGGRRRVAQSDVRGSGIARMPLVAGDDRHAVPERCVSNSDGVEVGWEPKPEVERSSNGGRFPAVDRADGFAECTAAAESFPRRLSPLGSPSSSPTRRHF